MRALAAVPLLLLGVYLAVRTIAALHRIVDLWYTIRTAWPKVLRGLVGWGGATVVAAALLPHGLRAALLWGFAAYLVFYLGLVVLRHLVFPDPDTRRQL